jgi:Flp pilus assembly protein TadG
MLAMSAKRRMQKRDGAAVVEFAIVAPIFFLLIVASLEFGRLNVIRHTADQAAYEAARAAMVPGAAANEAVQAAQGMLAIVGARGAQIAVNPPVLGPDDTQITVTIDVPMSQNGWITPRFTKNTTIHAVSRLRAERAGK